VSQATEALLRDCRERGIELLPATLPTLPQDVTGETGQGDHATPAAPIVPSAAESALSASAAWALWLAECQVEHGHSILSALQHGPQSCRALSWQLAIRPATCLASLRSLQQQGRIAQTGSWRACKWLIEKAGRIESGQ
jgi:hypothetical protein